MSAAALSPVPTSTDPLKGEDVIRLLTDPLARDGHGEAELLAPIMLAGKTIQNLILENQTVVRHVDFTEVTFTGDMSLKGTLFLAGVNFTKAVFQGLAEFDNATFEGALTIDLPDCSISQRSVYADLLPKLGTANFERTKFSCGATFIGTTFRSRATFKYSTFTGPAYFWRCRFDAPAFFSHLEVDITPADRTRHPKHQNRHAAEANFSYCFFKDSVDFSRARFHGHTFFHRTLFMGTSVKFETARFDDEVIFEGNQSDVCVSREELSVRMQEQLLDTHTLCENNDNQGFLNFEVPFIDASELQNHLDKRSELTQGEKDAVVKIWRTYSAPMLGPKQGVNFKNLFLSNKGDGTQFNNIDVINTGFRGTPLSRIKFLNITWPEKAIFWRLSKRKVLYDELLLPSLWAEIKSEFSFRRRHSGRSDVKTLQKKYAAIAILYQQLRRGYAADGLIAEARDFYFGEIQMARLALGIPHRWTSLSFVYRVLSGYGRQEGLAFAWLVFFLVVLFPALYWLLNPTLYDHWWAWPLSHSLRVATFLRDVGTSANPAAAPTVSRITYFVEGFERIVVAVQASLFVIAAKWRFDPGRFESCR